MSDEPNFTRSCYATDADLYKAKAAYYEAKVEELRELESICSGIAYARTAMNDKAVKIGLNKIDSYFAALKEIEGE